MLLKSPEHGWLGLFPSSTCGGMGQPTSWCWLVNKTPELVWLCLQLSFWNRFGLLISPGTPPKSCNPLVIKSVTRGQQGGMQYPHFQVSLLPCLQSSLGQLSASRIQNLPSHSSLSATGCWVSYFFVLWSSVVSSRFSIRLWNCVYLKNVYMFYPLAIRFTGVSLEMSDVFSESLHGCISSLIILILDRTL